MRTCLTTHVLMLSDQVGRLWMEWLTQVWLVLWPMLFTDREFSQNCSKVCESFTLQMETPEPTNVTLHDIKWRLFTGIMLIESDWWAVACWRSCALCNECFCTEIHEQLRLWVCDWRICYICQYFNLSTCCFLCFLLTAILYWCCVACDCAFCS